MKSFYESERDIDDKIVHILLYNTACNFHFHNSIEILYVVRGEVTYTCSSHSDTLKAGEAVFIPPFFSHQFYSVKPCETETIIIPPKYLHNYNKFCKDFCFPKLDNIEVNKQIKELFDKLLINTRNDNNDFLNFGLSDYLLSYIAANYPPQKYDKENSLMVDIATYLNTQYTSHVTLSDISNHFGYNTTYFSRLFKKLFNCNFGEYVNNLRINAIEARKGSASLTQLIYDAGYSSTSSYYRSQKESNAKPLNAPVDL